MYYNPILQVNINMHTRVTSATCKHSRGSAWLCHMALRGTSHPRGSTQKINLFLPFFNCFNHLKSKINLEKSEKIPKIKKFITFKI